MKVRLGPVYATEGFELTFMSQIGKVDLGDYLTKHANGDYGTIDIETRAANDVIAKSLDAGGYVISQWQFPDGESFQIATDRHGTMFQLLNEW